MQSQNVTSNVRKTVQNDPVHKLKHPVSFVIRLYSSRCRFLYHVHRNQLRAAKFRDRVTKYYHTVA